MNQMFSLFCTKYIYWQFYAFAKASVNKCRAVIFLEKPVFSVASLVCFCSLLAVRCFVTLVTSNLLKALNMHSESAQI